MSNMGEIGSLGDLFKGRRGLITGIANERSLAWTVAKMCSDAGAKLALTYQGEAVEKNANVLAKETNCSILEVCDVLDQESIAKLFKVIGQKWGKIDFLLHSIGFSNRHELRGRYVDTTLENFLMTMNVSCYSFTAMARHAAELMKEDGGSLLTLSYYGAEKSIPNYNVMGVAKAALESSVRYIAADLGKDKIRANALSAGPVRTLASSGIGDFRLVLKWVEKNSPMRCNVSHVDVAKSAFYLLSDLSSGVTGEVLHVDNGCNSVGMASIDSFLEEDKDASK
jgi:enoyl-[acyl-carrier protein] reductase I